MFDSRYSRRVTIGGTRGAIGQKMEVSMPKKQSSSKASTIAGKVLSGKKPTATETKTLAASVLSQDEKKGQGKGRGAK